MHYLIDGHNLIGKLPDISLDDPDDEAKLVLRLRSWAAQRRSRKVTVVFDHGLPGGVEKGLSSGQVKVLFATAGRTADAILINRVKNARNPVQFTLISSDRHVLGVAERRRMPVLRSEAFADRLLQDKRSDQQQPAEATKEDAPLTPEDIDMWLDLFQGDAGEKD